QQIAFLAKRDAQNGIWTMAAFGGSPTLLKSLDYSSRELVGWSKQGTIYFEMQHNLFGLNIATQQLSQLTKFDLARLVDRSFSVSPNEDRIAYTDYTGDQEDVWIVPIHGGTPTRITNDKAEDRSLAWTPDGERVLYSSNRNGIWQIFLAYADGRTPVQ